MKRKQPKTLEVCVELLAVAMIPKQGNAKRDQLLARSRFLFEELVRITALELVSGRIKVSHLRAMIKELKAEQKQREFPVTNCKV